jgi:hypothetical protein
MVSATQLTTVLHAGSRVNCSSFLSLCLRFSRLSRPGRVLLMSESVILIADSLYAEAIEAVNSRASISASSPELIWVLGEIEARLWNRSQSVNLSTGSERFLVLIWSSKWKTTGGWSESRMSRQWLLTAGYSCAQKYQLTFSGRRVMSRILWCWILN